jgi:hypothetical protein
MTVTARVVGELMMVASVTLLLVSAKGGRAAAFNGLDDLPLL